MDGKCSLFLGMLEILGKYFLHNSSTSTLPGSVRSRFTYKENKPQPNFFFKFNAKEEDTRLWLHALKCVLGLAFLNFYVKDVIVEVNPFSSRDLILLRLSNLIRALEDDRIFRVTSNPSSSISMHWL